MAQGTAEDIILDRYYEKCRMAGGPRKGYVLRKEAILYDAGDSDLEPGLDALVEAGLLKASESGNFYFLTEAGVERLAERAGG